VKTMTRTKVSIPNILTTIHMKIMINMKIIMRSMKTIQIGKGRNRIAFIIIIVKIVLSFMKR